MPPTVPRPSPQGIQPHPSTKEQGTITTTATISVPQSSITEHGPITTRVTNSAPAPHSSPASSIGPTPFEPPPADSAHKSITKGATSSAPAPHLSQHQVLSSTTTVSALSQWQPTQTTQTRTKRIHFPNPATTTHGAKFDSSHYKQFSTTTHIHPSIKSRVLSPNQLLTPHISSTP